MPVVRTKTRLENVDIQRVWEIVCDFERYPEMMDDVLEVEYMERHDHASVSSWKILLNGSEMMWVERDVYTPNKEIVFDQIEGDLEIYRGKWVLEEEENAVIVSLIIEFEIGIPSLKEMLDPIGIRAVKSNSGQMLESIKATSRAHTIG
jgi:ribosome-associated toxin RatA of RatAB toxin-antitoxin module